MRSFFDEKLQICHPRAKTKYASPDPQSNVDPKCAIDDRGLRLRVDQHWIGGLGGVLRFSTRGCYVGTLSKGWTPLDSRFETILDSVPVLVASSRGAEEGVQDPLPRVYMLAQPCPGCGVVLMKCETQQGGRILDGFSFGVQYAGAAFS